MAPLPLLCPRCGREQRVIPGGPDKPVRVVHAATGREECPDEPAPAPTAAQPRHPKGG